MDPVVTPTIGNIVSDTVTVNNDDAQKPTKAKRRSAPLNKSRKLNYTPRHFSCKIAETEWSKMKCAELKQMCVRFGLKVSGTKPALLERVRTHMRLDRAAILIQKRFRGFVAREMVRLKGPGYRTPKLCVNDCDFYSLDPLREIPDHRFFSYCDESGFVYAFDLLSLMTMYVKSRQIINPYNRKEVEFATICDIFSAYKKALVYYPQSELASLNRKKIESIRSRNRNDGEESNARTAVPRIVAAAETLRELREGRTVRERIVQTFMEIDNLGNYTDHRWFADLTEDQYLVFYRNYFRFWTGNQIPLDVRSKICAAEMPFSPIRRQDIQIKCVELVEWMVYTGADLEHRTLGALQVLSMLTTVSIRARQSLPWLSV